MDRMHQLEHLCGIDIGNTHVKLAAVINGHTFERMIPSGDSYTRDALIREVTEYYRSFNTTFRGIGIAFTGSTTDGCTVCHTPLSCLNGLSITDFYHLSQKVMLINDANAVALAGLLEYPNSKLLVGVTSGTGIGSAIALDGKLIGGSKGFAGEIYGNPVIGDSLNSTKVGRLCSGSKIYRKLNATDKQCSDESIIFEASLHMGATLVSLIHTLNPDTLYLAGGGFKFPGYIDLVYKYIAEHTYSYFLDDIVIAESRFGNIAGCVGAMALIDQTFGAKKADS